MTDSEITSSCNHMFSAILTLVLFFVCVPVVVFGGGRKHWVHPASFTMKWKTLRLPCLLWTVAPRQRHQVRASRGPSIDVFIRHIQGANLPLISQTMPLSLFTVKCTAVLPVRAMASGISRPDGNVFNDMNHDKSECHTSMPRTCGTNQQK